MEHLHARLLAVGDGVALRSLRCSHGRSGWEGRAHTDSPLLVIVQRGAFSRRTRAGEVLVDTGFGYFASPDPDEEFAHPGDGGDACTSLTMAPELLAEITGGYVDLPVRPVPIDSAAYLSWRDLMAEAADGRHDDWLERAINLFGDLLADAQATRATTGRGRTRMRHQRLADQARQALISDPTLSVRELGRIIGYSPYHLSRVFHRQTGATLSAYRLRLRTRDAADRINSGEKDLARLAAELGFSDHSHLTRLLVREVGATPSAMRATRAHARQPG